MRKTLAVIGGLALAVTTLASCGKSPDDYRKAAAAEIGGADTARMIGHQFSNIECEDPGATSKGTTFVCTADSDDGKPYEFVATIVSSNRIEITDYSEIEAADTSAP
jgi:hypothetical protein